MNDNIYTIALFIKDNPYGYPDTSTRYVFREIIKNCKNIKWIIFCNDVPRTDHPSNVELKIIEKPYMTNVYNEFRNYIKYNKVDFVISFDICGFIPAIYSKLILKKPVIVINFAINGFIRFIFTKDVKYFEPHWWLLQFILFSIADKIITASNLSKKYNFLFRNKIEVVGHGVDNKIFYKFKNFKQREDKLLFVGHLEKRKGIDILFKVLKELERRYDGCIKITLVGKPNKWIKSLINNIKINNNKVKIEFKYNLTYKELMMEYNSAKVFIFLSRYDGWGLVVSEALACGTPVIISNRTGAQDIVLKYKCGFVVDLNDYDKIVKYITLLLNNENLWTNLSENGLKAIKEYKWQNISKNFIKVLEVLNYHD